MINVGKVYNKDKVSKMNNLFGYTSGIVDENCFLDQMYPFVFYNDLRIGFEFECLFNIAVNFKHMDIINVTIYDDILKSLKGSV